MERKHTKIDQFVHSYQSVFLSLGILVMVGLIGVTLHSWQLVYLSYLHDQTVLVAEPSKVEDSSDELEFEEVTTASNTTEEMILSNLNQLKIVMAESTSTEETTMDLEDHQSAIDQLAEFVKESDMEVSIEE